MMSEAERIASGLSVSQRAYIAALAASATPYAPRHGNTANWALRHRYADTIVRLNDGREGPWDSFEMGDRVEVGVAELLGQCLTPLGLEVKRILEEKR